MPEISFRLIDDVNDGKRVYAKYGDRAAWMPFSFKPPIYTYYDAPRRDFLGKIFGLTRRQRVPDERVVRMEFQRCWDRDCMALTAILRDTP